MRIGVPKEIKVHEYRVGLVPAGVRELIAAGHEVMVETGTTALAMDAERTLLIDRAEFVSAADRAGITAVAVQMPSD